MNWFKKASNSLPILNALKPQIIQSAQNIYDQWEAGEEGDPEIGFGGICDEIGRAIANIIVSNTDFEVQEAGQPGDDHSWILVKTPEGIYEIDIPPHVYEQGGGYSWTKIPDAQFDEDDVIITFLGNNTDYWLDEY